MTISYLQLSRRCSIGDTFSQVRICLSQYSPTTEISPISKTGDSSIGDKSAGVGQD